MTSQKIKILTCDNTTFQNNLQTVLEKGRPLFNTESKKFYVGDGETRLLSLSPVSAGICGRASSADTADTAGIASATSKALYITVNDDLGTRKSWNGSTDLFLNFYQPTDCGEYGQYLVSDGPERAPRWTTRATRYLKTMNVKFKYKLGSSNYIGSFTISWISNDKTKKDPTTSTNGSGIFDLLKEAVESNSNKKLPISGSIFDKSNSTQVAYPVSYLSDVSDDTGYAEMKVHYVKDSESDLSTDTYAYMMEGQYIQIYATAFNEVVLY